MLRLAEDGARARMSQRGVDDAFFEERSSWSFRLNLPPPGKTPTELKCALEDEFVRVYTSWWKEQGGGGWQVSPADKQTGSLLSAAGLTFPPSLAPPPPSSAAAAASVAEPVGRQITLEEQLKPPMLLNVRLRGGGSETDPDAHQPVSVPFQPVSVPFQIFYRERQFMAQHAAGTRRYFAAMEPSKLEALGEEFETAALAKAAAKAQGLELCILEEKLIRALSVPEVAAASVWSWSHVGAPAVALRACQRML